MKPHAKRKGTVSRLAAGLILIILCALAPPVRGATDDDVISDEQAIRVIVGEAANQGDRGMLAVACAIRNRGSLRGVYGLHATFVDRELPETWERARNAWQQSARRDITGGATHWENVRAFGTPAWARRMTRTVTVRDHAFFK